MQASWQRNRSKGWTALFAGLALAIGCVASFAADPPPKNAEPAKTDDALRSKLDDDLFGDLKPGDKPAPPIEKKPVPEKPAPEKPVPEKPDTAEKPAEDGKPKPEKKTGPVRIGGDADLRRSLEEDRGEDFGAEKPSNPLIEIGERMQKVRERLAAGDASKEVQAEEQAIIEQIGKLMEQAQQQQKKQSKSPNSTPSTKPQPKPGDMGKEPAPAGEGDPNTTSKKPADDSTERVGAAKSDAGGTVPREVLVKKAWGHLPPRLRERLINTPVDRFLPEYEQLIEDYFRRLAEERGDRP